MRREETAAQIIEAKERALAEVRGGVMELIKCVECSQKVSDNIPTCPHCGATIVRAAEQKEVEVPLMTIQETGKGLTKNQILISASLFFCGILLLFKSASMESESRLPGFELIAVLLMVSGIIFYVVTKIRIWRHHRKTPIR